MKALLVADNPKAAAPVKAAFRGRAEVFVYNSPVKALNNLEELSPDIAVINAAEFPRHWAVLAEHARTALRVRCGVFLLTGTAFTPADAETAASLGVKGIIPEAELLSRGASALESCALLPHPALPHPPEAGAPRLPRTEFLFRSPRSGRLVTGAVESVRGSVIVFIPDGAGAEKPFAAGQVIAGASFKNEGALSVVDAEVLAAGDGALVLSVKPRAEAV